MKCFQHGFPCQRDAQGAYAHWCRSSHRACHYLDDEPPVVLLHVVDKELLERVDALARDARHKLVAEVKVAAVHAAALFSVGRFDLECDALACARRLDRLVVELHGRDAPKVDAAARWHADRRANLRDALQHLAPEHDRVLDVEDAVGQDLERARKHSGQACCLLLLPAHLLHVRRELVKQVVDDVGGEDLDVVLLRERDRVARDDDVEREDHRVLLERLAVLALLLVHDVGAQHVLLVHRPDVNARHGDVHVGRRQERQQRLE
eukprot:361837-Chlamydomonas_euryale.AAC.5